MKWGVPGRQRRVWYVNGVHGRGWGMRKRGGLCVEGEGVCTGAGTAECMASGILSLWQARVRSVQAVGGQLVLQRVSIQCLGLLIIVPIPRRPFHLPILHNCCLRLLTQHNSQSHP